MIGRRSNSSGGEQEHRGKKEQCSSRKCQCFVCPAFKSAGVVVAKKPERERG